MAPIIYQAFYLILIIFSGIILKNKFSFLSLLLIIFALFLEVISVYTINKAIDIVDFGFNHSEANVWMVTSFTTFLLGMSIIVYLYQKSKPTKQP